MLRPGTLALCCLLAAGCGALAPSPSPAPAPVAPAAPPAAPPPALAAAEPEPPPAPTAAPAPACPALDLAPLPRATAAVDPPLVPIEDEARAMESFYEKLAALARGTRREPLRVAVYGDSNITADWTTGGLRRTLQGRLGDAGHGFVALGKPWPGYVHMDVKHGLDKPGWMVRAVSTRPIADHRYGFAGIIAQSTGPGARTWVETAGPSAPVGRAAGRIGVHFLRGPGLGSFEVRVDGQRRALIDTEAPSFAAGHALVDVDDGRHQTTFEARSNRPVRLFGATLERDRPGIVIDSLGVAASTTATILRQERSVFLESLRQRGYDLVVLAHGSFDVMPWNTEEFHAASVRSMIDLHREARPGVAVLVLSPVDYRGPLDDSRASPARAASEKRSVARACKAAFWDLRGAMGGDRSIYNFQSHRMADTDHIHLNQKGGEFIGNRLALALWGGLAAHAARDPAAGCGAPAPASVEQR